MLQQKIKPFDPALPTRVLFVGGGQDSVALLLKYYYDAEFRAHFVGDANFVCLMADTANEYPQTKAYVHTIMDWCQQVGIEFYLITADMGYHGRTWQSLTYQMELNNTIMGVAFQKSCTDQLKVQVCYRFLGDWLRKKYRFTALGYKVFYQYKALFGKLISWIGFAAGEEKRVDKPAKPRKVKVELNQPNRPDTNNTLTIFENCELPRSENVPKWRQLTVAHEYPLITMGMDRAACQRTIEGYGHVVPFPSNCMLCPFQGQVEVVYLYKVFPAMWAYWVEREAAKLAKFAGKPVNLGVKGNITLTQYLEKALKLYDHWSIAQLEEYRFSHGHCVMSKM